MNSIKFISDWKKTREKGIGVYVFRCTILILIASIIGKAIGHYSYNGTIFKTFSLPDIAGVLFICLIGFLAGIFLWNHNETRYIELIKSLNNKEN